ncbi:carbohydrate kinase family protein [Wenyingzhuangia marina]|uniref:Fructokinase n=1 Tax=Wenyingzhuangia marina TaxID=1195760 RepID=A0A1M5VC09_9FLAO|nr:carbohydrate kinase [Wenyingzhuangia marina]GGF73115.1 carbohydrate kinase [Wenyingzhuangia marina]SHH72731.1 fructokinase [Wenyingzhuangia marina]
MFHNKDLKFVSYGEVLFDVFKTAKKIGGAPLNLALRIKSFGFPVTMISAVGNDKDGSTLVDYINNHGIDTSGIIIKNNYDTGVVTVELSKSGSATYTIEHPSAWDKIEINQSLKNIVSSSDVFLYGSLACRDEVSRTTLYNLLKNNKSYKVFDVNLRASHYKIDTLKNLMSHADFIKFNDEELLEISAELGSTSKSIEENIHFISQYTNTDSICVTKGKHGAVLLWKGILYYNAGFLIKVIDTVGAGDSFLASLITQLLSNGNPQKAIDFACAIGSIVAGHEGANPEIKEEDIYHFLNPQKQ